MSTWPNKSKRKFHEKIKIRVEATENVNRILKKSIACSLSITCVKYLNRNFNRNEHVIRKINENAAKLDERWDKNDLPGCSRIRRCLRDVMVFSWCGIQSRRRNGKKVYSTTAEQRQRLGGIDNHRSPRQCFQFPASFMAPLVFTSVCDTCVLETRTMWNSEGGVT